ncbi:MAG: hypothetical protein ACI4DY_07020 [Monoglobaceae bacterium]
MNVANGIKNAAKAVVKISLIITTILTIGDNIQQLEDLIKKDN